MTTQSTVELFPLHRDHHARQDIINQCCAILNFEWPRSETLRLRSLTSSCEDLPTCLALIQAFNGRPSVLGHARVTQIPSEDSSVWIESVVIHPDLRGRGWGKYLMLKVEDYCMNKFRTRAAYLCTADMQAFYSRIGYTFCDPIVSCGGNSKMAEYILSLSPKRPPLQPSPIHAIKDVIERQIDSVSNHTKYADPPITFAQNLPTLSTLEPPKLESPPRIPSVVKNLSPRPKETRMFHNRDYMKKRISSH